jgi:cbb3-type cytochrome oxidase maturation protein
LLSAASGSRLSWGAAQCQFDDLDGAAWRAINDDLPEDER